MRRNIFSQRTFSRIPSFGAAPRKSGAWCLPLMAAAFALLLSLATAFQTQTQPCQSPRITSIALHSSNNNQRPQPKVDKGFNLLEIASGVVPQGKIVSGVKETWKFGWKRMMAELAPQDKSGRYTRPSYDFQGKIGTPTFPDEPGRYHLLVGNPCPVSRRIMYDFA